MRATDARARLRAEIRDRLPQPVLRSLRARGSSFFPWTRIRNRDAIPIDKPLIAYLARRHEGLEVFSRFIESYKQHPDETRHDLLIIFKGFPNRGSKESFYRAAAGVTFFEMEKADTGFDIGSFRKACERFPYSHYLFLGSFCRILSDNYLTKLLNCLRRAPRAGIAGPTGSWEQCVGPRFPNYHIRTCAFILSREVMTEVRWPVVLTKWDAWQFELGERGLTRQVLSLGLEPYVVRSDGRWASKEDWPASETYRQGEQARLMIADKWTDLFASAGDETRSCHSRLAWGAGA